MKLHVWLLLVLLSVPQAGHGETLASSADHIDGLLTLKGLRLIYEKNQPKA